MKSYANKFILICTIIFLGVLNMNGQEKYFDNAEEAIRQARQDLMAVLEKGTDFNFELSAEELKNAEAVANIEFRQIDFNTLLNPDSISSLSELRSKLMYYVVPLVSNAKVVTNVQIAQAEGGWMISGLMNNSFTSALNKLPADIRNRNMKSVTIYEFPNIHALLYVVKREQEEMIFTDYTGRYNLQQAVELSEIYPVLQNDAREFQEKWGGQLKDQKLVK